MLEVFEFGKVKVSTGQEIACRKSGSGPPLLLLHGFPQNNLMWSKIAPALAKKFTVVMSDLRGYGDSSKPTSDAENLTYSFREMARDQVALMKHFGFDSFLLAGHDRGARVSHRMCLDFPDQVEKIAILDIAPTLDMYEMTDQVFATAYYHWFFLIQPSPLPERLIAGDPDLYMRSCLGKWSMMSPTEVERVFTPDVMKDYLRCYETPEAIHATCEDYRAGATIDLVHDRIDRDAQNRIKCPVLVLWGDKGLFNTRYSMLDIWARACAQRPLGRAIASGHFLAEDNPEETLAELQAFFSGAD
jgi:haloacetate dehalogenase